MKTISTVIITALLVSIISIAFFMKMNLAPKIVYVKAETLFNEFTMTVELKSSYEQSFNARTNILDSILLDLKKASLQNDASQVGYLEKVYLTKKDQFTQENEEMTRKYDEQVWMRINQYVKDFSEKEKYEFVLSANGTGSLIYGADKYDVTKDVLEYMNASYKGVKK